MPAGDGFRVAIKESARSILTDAPAVDPDDAGIVAYQSRAAAESAIEGLQTDGDTDGSLALQSPAPNDATEVDAYLVAYPETRKWDPEGSSAEGWTFDVTASQYGALGEALVTAPGAPPLRHFVRRDLEERFDRPAKRRDPFRLDVLTRPAAFDKETLEVAPTDGDRRWVPDCEVRVRLPDRRDVFHRYFCEIKTGDGALERNQDADMTAVSAVADVLEIRVDVEGLPEAYEVQVRRVGDSTSDSDAASTRVRTPDRPRDAVGGTQAGLSEFGE
jgi:hypothetical protein